MSDSLGTHGLQPTRLLCPWNSPGKNTGVGSHFLLPRIFVTQGSNLGLPHWQADSSPSEPPYLTTNTIEHHLGQALLIILQRNESNKKFPGIRPARELFRGRRKRLHRWLALLMQLQCLFLSIFPNLDPSVNWRFIYRIPQEWGKLVWV